MASLFLDFLHFMTMLFFIMKKVHIQVSFKSNYIKKEKRMHYRDRVPEACGFALAPGK